MKKNWTETLAWAKSGLQSLQNQYPEAQDIHSAILQIEYLEDLDRGTQTDDSRLEEIILGHLAMYSLSDIISHDLSSVLCDISCKIERDLRRQGRQMKN